MKEESARKKRKEIQGRFDPSDEDDDMRMGSRLAINTLEGRKKAVGGSSSSSSTAKVTAKRTEPKDPPFPSKEKTHSYDIYRKIHDR